MKAEILATLVAILIVLIVFYTLFPRKEREVVIKAPDFKAMSPAAKPFEEMSTNEKIDFIFKVYFDFGADTQEAEKRQKEDAYIASLPVSSECPDLYDGCPAWAENDECEINPEFMLYACPKSCSACSYSEQDKSNLVKIYNSRPPLHSVYHGANYPGPWPYLNVLYDYMQPRY